MTQILPLRKSDTKTNHKKAPLCRKTRCFFDYFVKKAVIFHIFFKKLSKNLFIFHKTCAIIKLYQATISTVQKGGSLYENDNQW